MSFSNLKNLAVLPLTPLLALALVACSNVGGGSNDTSVPGAATPAPSADGGTVAPSGSGGTPGTGVGPALGGGGAAPSSGSNPSSNAGPSGGTAAGSGSAPSSTPVVPSPIPDHTANPLGNIHMANSVPANQQASFAAALQFLDQNPAPAASADLLSFMGIASFESSVVRKWLEDRIQYIVPETQKLDETLISVVQMNYTDFQNPGVIPPEMSGGTSLYGLMRAAGMSVSADAGPGKTVMSNIGAVLYVYGKKKQALLGIKADGLGLIPMTSPRAGILRVGEGIDMIPDSTPISQNVFRLMTLVHESHHSDGNSTHVGFLHAKCLSGDFVGISACDHNLNGPYEIGAMVTKAYLDRCDGTCSANETAMLRMIYLDNANRRIDDATTALWDSAPEGSRQANSLPPATT